MNFLGIQGTYSGLQISFFLDGNLSDQVSLAGTKSSSRLVPALQDLFKRHHFSLNQLDFIAVDKGPGAFTSLRVTLATVNGIGYAAGIPLIGVSGLKALAQEATEAAAQERVKMDGVVCLLNAYGNDLYFYFSGIGGDEQGCANVTEVFAKIHERCAGKRLLFVGNGVALHEMLLSEVVRSAQIEVASLSEQLETSSAYYVGLLGAQKWHEKKDISTSVTPHYLKEQAFSLKK